MSLRLRGTVTRWNNYRGFGSIKMDDTLPGDREVFVHRSAIRPGQRRYLMTGDVVWFSLEPGQKPGSVQAANVIIYDGEVDPFNDDEDDGKGDEFGPPDDEDEGDPLWPGKDDDDEDEVGE